MVKNSENICAPVRRTPHFFKVVLPNITTHHLRIPVGFLKHISEEESDRAILEGPSGHQWHVKLGKTKDGTYLQDGWQDFVRDHSLCCFEFLVFRYDGNMCFNVKIYDKTGYERVDVCTTKTQEGLTFPIEKKFVSCASKRRGSPPKKGAGSADLFPPSACYVGKKRGSPPKLFAGSTNLFASRDRQRDSEAVADKRIKTEEISNSTCEEEPQARHGLSGRKAKNEEIKAKERKATESFSSSHPYFAKSLDWYKATEEWHVLNIPRVFSRAHLPRYSTKFLLRNSRGEDWIVSLKFHGRRYAYLGGGWSDFVRDNELKEGDICIFELVSKYEFCVHIFQ